MKKTILLADDSVTIQKVVELTFMDEEFQVASVNNGAEAIAKLGESTPDVVISDVHMPGADGYEVCRRSKEIHPRVPVLLLVGTFESFDSDAAERCGADGHLKKPFDSQELLRRVRELAAADRVATPQPAAAPPAPTLAPPVVSDSFDQDSWESIPDEIEETVFAATAERSEALRADSAESQGEPHEPIEEVSVRRIEVAPRAGFASGSAAASSSAPGAAPAFDAPASAAGPLSDADVDRIARRVIELLGDKPVRDVAWEVVPDLAELLLKSRIRELEAAVE